MCARGRSCSRCRPMKPSSTSARWHWDLIRRLTTGDRKHRSWFPNFIRATKLQQNTADNEQSPVFYTFGEVDFEYINGGPADRRATKHHRTIPLAMSISLVLARMK